MDVRITNIQGQGNASDEYVALTVDKNCDIGDYMLADTTYASDGSVSNKLRHIYWFPKQDVKKGDSVVLRTGTGKDTTVKLASGGTLYRYFWNLRSAVWNDEADAAVLLHISDLFNRKAK